MSDIVDLQPAADRLSALVRGVRDTDLIRQTPCDIPVSRLVVPERLDRLSGVWKQADQDGSMTRVGGIDLPRAIAVRVALQELVLHGWDLARATGQPYDVDAESLAIVHHMVTTTADAPRDGLFGPVVVVPDDASVLDRTVGLAGRSPAWPQ